MHFIVQSYACINQMSCSFQLLFNVFDRGTPSLSDVNEIAVVTVTILRNQNPIISPTPIEQTINENVPIGHTVFTFNVDDPDSNVSIGFFVTESIHVDSKN